MTLGEFLHPLSKASQRDLVLAVMYFLKRYEGSEAVTTADIKAAFTTAKHARGKKIQHAAVLNQAVPFVHSPGSDGTRLLWSLTETGDGHIRGILGLPADQPEIEHDVSTLQAVASRLADPTVRGYVEEAILCLRVGALRAAIVFMWSGAASALRDAVWASGAMAIDAAIKSHNPKARDFKKRDDFAYIKDVELLQVAEDLGAIDKTEKKLLGNALDVRNACGHPTNYNPGPKKASAFIEDLVAIVWR